jgi:hypothetical protein
MVEVDRVKLLYMQPSLILLVWSFLGAKSDRLLFHETGEPSETIASSESVSSGEF